MCKRKNKDETKYWLCQNRKCSASVLTLNEYPCLINEVHNGWNGIYVEFTSRLMRNSGSKRRAIDVEKDNKYKNLN